MPTQIDDHPRLVVGQRPYIVELDLWERNVWVLRKAKLRDHARVVDAIVAQHVAIRHLIGERTGRHTKEDWPATALVGQVWTIGSDHRATALRAGFRLWCRRISARTPCIKRTCGAHRINRVRHRLVRTHAIRRPAIWGLIDTLHVGLRIVGSRKLLLRLEDHHLNGRGREPSSGIEKDFLLASEPIVPLAALNAKDREANGYVGGKIVPLCGQLVEQRRLLHDCPSPTIGYLLVCHDAVLSFTQGVTILFLLLGLVGGVM